MAWWQVAIVIAGAVGIGLAAGYLINQIIVRASVVVRRQDKPPEVQTEVEPVPQVEKAKLTVQDLYEELENNRRIAIADWSGEPQPFVTRAWDDRGGEIHSLPAEVRTELAEAYSDMALANSITWLSTEMGRRSQSLDESYLKLRNSVADRLNRVKLHLTLPGEPAKVAAPR